MQVQITGGADDWRKWGELVRSWIFNPSSRPNNTVDMQNQINSNYIAATVPGPKREVKFYDYDDTKLNMPMPTEKMVTDDETSLVGPSQYPLPNFYPIAFGGAGEVNLSSSELLAFCRRRLGEYTIQECQ
jgi:hypothetical protein